jgi:PKD repeat protein
MVACLAVHDVVAQKEGNIWYFGRYAGLDFNNDTVFSIQNGAMWANDNSSSISDTNGQILFYTNSDTVWNRLHQIMFNGTGLAGSTSSGQCAVIVPQPGTPRYYIFTNAHFTSSQGLCYSIVDIAEDNGYGAVILKNHQLFPYTTEKLDAIYNPGDNSYWIITHPFESGYFNVYKLDLNGLSPNPVISDPCVLYSGGNPYGYNAIGQMTVAPNGKMIASGVLSTGFIELCDFNMSTGKITNSRVITDFPNAWGIAFSSNSKLLYATRWWSDSVFQYNLTDTTLSSIISSKRLAGHATATNSYNYQAGYMQLGHDSRIYITRYQTHYLAVINYPDKYGTDCGFVNDGMFLGKTMSNAGLSRVPSRCNLPVSNFIYKKNGLSVSYTDTSVKTDAWLWRFGDGTESTMKNPVHTYPEYKKYKVCLTTSNLCGDDTKCDSIDLNCIPPVAGFTYVINEPNVNFFDSSSFAQYYYWDFGDSYYSSVKNPVHAYEQHGKYFVCLSVTDSCGTDRYCDTVYFCTPPEPDFSFLNNGHFVEFIDSSYQATSWFWDFDDGFFSDLSNPVHYFKNFGTYYICLTATNICKKQTFCDSILVKPNGIENRSATKILIYPNPTKDLLEIELSEPFSPGTTGTIIDLYGRSVLDIHFTSLLKQTLDLSGLSDGVYFLRINDVNSLVYRKMICLKN